MQHSSNKNRNSVALYLEQLQLKAQAEKENGAFAKAQKTIRQAITTAQQHELYGTEILLQHQYLQLLSFTKTPSGNNTLCCGVQKIAGLIHQQTETESLHLIYHQLLNLRYRVALGISAEERQEILRVQHQLQAYMPENLESFTSRIYFYQSSLLICFMLGSTENVGMYNQELLRCWGQQTQLIACLPELFVRSVSAQAYTHFLCKETGLVSCFLDQYRQLAHMHLSGQWYHHWFNMVDFHTTLKVLHKTYQYAPLATYFSNHWPSVYATLYVLREAEQIDILISACITFFVLNQWQEAEALIREVKEINRKVKRSDTLYFSFVFHCLILYEQKEWNRLNSLINSQYHFLYCNNTLRPFERDMLLFIKKLPVVMLKGSSKNSMKTFLQKLDAYRDHQTQKLHFTYFDFCSWIESKIEGMSYAGFLRQKNRQGI